MAAEAHAALPHVALLRGINVGGRNKVPMKDLLACVDAGDDYADVAVGRGRTVSGLDPAAAAPLLCAGITVWEPLRALGVGPGTRVAVAGLVRLVFGRPA